MKQSMSKLKQRKHRAGVATRLDRIEKHLLAISNQIARLSNKMEAPLFNYDVADLTKSPVSTIAQLRKALKNK